jgi:glycosyltransferase involved in cell wall biosynthesis
VYNEQASVSDLLSRIRSSALPDGVEREIIVVDDGSADGTSDTLAAESRNPDTRVVRHARNLGKGAAVQTGLGLANGNIVVIQDADLEYDPAVHASLVEPVLRGEVEVVYGSRFLVGRPPMSARYWMANLLFNRAVQILFGGLCTDVLTGQKVLTAAVAASCEFRSPRWGWDVELTAQLLKRGKSIREVSVPYMARKRSEGKKPSLLFNAIPLVVTLLACRIRGVGRGHRLGR